MRAGKLALVLGLTVNAAAWSASGPPGVPDLSGTYWATEYHPTLQPLGGGTPPLNEAGKAEHAKNRAGLRDGSIADPVRKYCLPDGIPRLLATPYPFQLYQLPAGQVTFVHELNSQVRVVPLDKPLPPYEQAVLFLTYGGYSSAHYDGDTLVIQSNGFNDQTFLDSSGLPHGDQLVTTERIRRNGNQLEDLVTIHDPQFYSRDWQVRFAYQRRPGLRLQEYACGDVHRDISGVKGVTEVRTARAQGRFP